MSDEIRAQSDQTINSIWVPILKKDEEQYQELKFYGINNWYFV
jgi:hypothetical protein